MVELSLDVARGQAVVLRTFLLLGAFAVFAGPALAGETRVPLRPGELLAQAERWTGRVVEVEILERRARSRRLCPSTETLAETSGMSCPRASLHAPRRRLQYQTQRRCSTFLATHGHIDVFFVRH